MRERERCVDLQKKERERERGDTHLTLDQQMFERFTVEQGSRGHLRAGAAIFPEHRPLKIGICQTKIKNVSHTLTYTVER